MEWHEEFDIKKTKYFLILTSHLTMLGAGFIAGLYMLPILTAPPGPDVSVVEKAVEVSEFVGEFSRDRVDSDGLHWGEGEFAISSDTISFVGKLSPGPDYRLYLSPEFVETEAEFLRLKSSMVQAGEVKTFDNFLVPIKSGIDPSEYNTAIVWCESFGQYITSGSYESRKK